MNAKEFATELSQQTGKSVKETTSLISALTAEMGALLEADNLISIQGFGSFEVKKKLEHIVVNPSTHQRMLVPPKMEIKFKASAVIKDKLKD